LRPSNISVNGRTSQTEVRRHLLSRFDGLSSYLVMRHRLEVCPLSREVMLQPTRATSIPFITKGLSLSPASSTDQLIGVPYGSLSQADVSAGRLIGLPRSVQVPN
jgi:hypothetical protein